MKKILIILFLGLLIIAGAVLYIYNKPHRNVASEEPAYRLSAAELFQTYQEDEDAANARYLDKVLQVSGVADELATDNKGDLILIMREEEEMFGISCSMNPAKRDSWEEIKPGDQVKVKGICTGGGTMMDVQMVRCEVIKY